MSILIAWLKRVFDITDTVVTRVYPFRVDMECFPIWLQLESGERIVLDNEMSKKLGIELGDEVLIVVRKGAGR